MTRKKFMKHTHEHVQGKLASRKPGTRKSNAIAANV